MLPVFWRVDVALLPENGVEPIRFIVLCSQQSWPIKRRHLFMALTLYVPFAVLALWYFGSTATYAASADIIDAAKKEGEMNWYGGG